MPQLRRVGRHLAYWWGPYLAAAYALALYGYVAWLTR